MCICCICYAQVRLTKADFERLLGPLQALIDRDRRRREEVEEKRAAVLEKEGLKNVRRSTLALQARACASVGGGIFLAKHLTTQREYSLLGESKAAVCERELPTRTRERQARGPCCDAMLCDAMRCDAVPCYAVLCCAMLCYAVLRGGRDGQTFCRRGASC